jgi:LmbE family N-acetylglucosaminyl deacetylase
VTPVPKHPPRHSLFVFAHQDDECLLSTRIAREVEAGRRVHCVYLTAGSGPGVPSEVRDAESRAVLADLGAAAEDIHFIGSVHGIPDGDLSLHLGEALHRLEEAVGRQPIHRIFTLAYEGGHQDHDAAHAAALVFAGRRDLLHRTWAMPAYHGHRLPWILYRVAAALPDRPRRVRRLPRGLAWRHAWIPWRYPSQRRTWIGLFPELFVQRALRRREVLIPADAEAIRARPHPGSLLYERLFRFPYESFRRGVDAFLDSQSLGGGMT